MKKILLVLLVLGLAGAGYGYYLWNKPPESNANKAVTMGIPATQLVADFKADEAAANAKYLGDASKIIAVTGKVAEVKDVNGTFKVALVGGDDGTQVLCEFDPQTTPARTTFAVGEEVTFKGECAGADLDGTVNLARCVEVK